MHFYSIPSKFTEPVVLSCTYVGLNKCGLDKYHPKTAEEQTHPQTISSPCKPQSKPPQTDV